MKLTYKRKNETSLNETLFSETNPLALMPTKKITQKLLYALGYEIQSGTKNPQNLYPVVREVPPKHYIPLLGEIRSTDGSKLLWLLPVVEHSDESFSSNDSTNATDPLSSTIPFELLQITLEKENQNWKHQTHQIDLEKAQKSLQEHTVEELVTQAFGREDPPRFLLILGETQWILAERAKWPEQRMLRFDWEQILGRREKDTLESASTLLHRECLAPESGGTALIDTLDDNSHKHAYEVSEDLKYALRESIELLGNEAIRYRREVSKKKVFGEKIDGDDLARECMRYMYRLLFLLYVEALPELGYAPMGSDAYRQGYSFERLRDLEAIKLETEQARNADSYSKSPFGPLKANYHSSRSSSTCC